MDNTNHKNEIKKIRTYFLNIIKKMAKYTHMTQEEQDNILIYMDGGYMGLGDAEEIFDIVNSNKESTLMISPTNSELKKKGLERDLRGNLYSLKTGKKV